MKHSDLSCYPRPAAAHPSSRNQPPTIIDQKFHERSPLRHPHADQVARRSASSRSSRWRWASGPIPPSSASSMPSCCGRCLIRIRTSLVLLREKMPIFDSGSVSYPNYLDWRAMQRSFTDLALYRHDSMNLSSRGEETPPERVEGGVHDLEHDAIVGLKAAPRSRLYREGRCAGRAEGCADQRRALETAFWRFEKSARATTDRRCRPAR